MQLFKDALFDVKYNKYWNDNAAAVVRRKCCGGSRKDAGRLRGFYEPTVTTIQMVTGIY